VANLAPTIYAALGTLCLVRGLFRPHRAVLHTGMVVRCAGRDSYGSCDPADTLRSQAGESVYAVAPGTIAAVGESFLHLVAGNDAVIVMYDGVVPEVSEGQHVGLGQRIALVGDAGTVRFSVTQLEPDASSQLGYVTRVLPPGGWLAARGLRYCVDDRGGGTNYCEGGRHISVPPDDNAICHMLRPEPGRFGLLPINVELR
jgi:hypothetical protein